jgi:hypothetical protein
MSEVTARVAGAFVWLLGAVALAYGYATRDDEGLDSLGNALALVMIVAPALVLGIVTLVALGLRLRTVRVAPVGALTWLLAGAPAVLGVLVVVRQLSRAL